MPGPGRREAGRARLIQLGSRNNLFDRCVMGTGGSEREPAQEGCPVPAPTPPAFLSPSGRPPRPPGAPAAGAAGTWRPRALFLGDHGRA